MEVFYKNSQQVKAVNCQLVLRKRYTADVRCYIDKLELWTFNPHRDIIWSSSSWSREFFCKQFLVSELDTSHVNELVTSSTVLQRAIADPSFSYIPYVEVEISTMYIKRSLTNLDYTWRINLKRLSKFDHDFQKKNNKINKILWARPKIKGLFKF